MVTTRHSQAVHHATALLPLTTAATSACAWLAAVPEPRCAFLRRCSSHGWRTAALARPCCSTCAQPATGPAAAPSSCGSALEVAPAHDASHVQSACRLDKWRAMRAAQAIPTHLHRSPCIPTPDSRHDACLHTVQRHEQRRRHARHLCPAAERQEHAGSRPRTGHRAKTRRQQCLHMEHRRLPGSRRCVRQPGGPATPPADAMRAGRRLRGSHATGSGLG